MVEIHRPDELNDYLSQLLATKQFNELIAESKIELENVYKQDISEQEKRVLKQQVFDTLKQRYEKLKESHWGNKGWFDRWFNRPLNNARLASFSTYYDQVPALEQLLQQCGNDLDKFYRVIEEQGVDVSTCN